MTVANDLHNQAMESVDYAFFARKRGNEEEAQRFFEDAFAKEVAAINALEERERVEPMYSVLHRSAATLALDCGRLREAEKWAAKGLTLEPYPEIVEELRDVLEQATFERHLELRGIELAGDEMQMSLSGKGVGLGFAALTAVTSRATDTAALITRITERLAGKPFREAGRPDESVRRQTLYLSPSRVGSFAVTLRLAKAPGQSELPGLTSATSVIDEFFTLMNLINDNRFEELQKHIPDPVYLRNCLALTKKIAPDGRDVSQVGFTVIREGKKESTAMRRMTNDIPLGPPREKESSSEVEHYSGKLLFADATKANKIKLLAGDKTQTIIVRDGMMDDIVRPMWNTYVLITGFRRGRQIILEDIAPAEPPE